MSVLICIKSDTNSVANSEPNVTQKCAQSETNSGTNVKRTNVVSSECAGRKRSYTLNPTPTMDQQILLTYGSPEASYRESNSRSLVYIGRALCVFSVCSLFVFSEGSWRSSEGSWGSLRVPGGLLKVPGGLLMVPGGLLEVFWVFQGVSWGSLGGLLGAQKLSRVGPLKSSPKWSKVRC